MTLARTTVAGITRTMRSGTAGSETTPSRSARMFHPHRPATTPSGTPISRETVARVVAGHGRRIKAKGCYRDPVRSSRKHVVKCFGLKWVALVVLVPVPWSHRVWALPLLTSLSWPEGTGRRASHKTAKPR